MVSPGRHEPGHHHPLPTPRLELQDLTTGLAVISSFKVRFSVKYKYISTQTCQEDLVVDVGPSEATAGGREVSSRGPGVRVLCQQLGGAQELTARVATSHQEGLNMNMS